MSLSAKRRVFVEEYLKIWNATKAAEIAGYKYPRQQGSRLLSFVDIQEYIEARLSELKMGADEVLIRLAEQARADISFFVKSGGGIDWERVAQKGYLVKSIAHKTGEHSRIELYDAQSALQLIGKFHKLFTEKLEHTGVGGGPVTLRVVYEDERSDE